MDHDRIAAELAEARSSGRVLDAPSRRHPGFTIGDGYRVGRILHDRRLAAGAVPAGAKLGFTNPAYWEALGIDAPFRAPIYEDTVTRERTVTLAGLVAPRLEPEIVLGLGAPLAPGATADEVRGALSFAALGFEVVQCRYPGWALAPADAIADAGLHGLLVVGDTVALGAGDLDALADSEVVLERDGVEVGRGSAREALGGPAAAIDWLLRLPGAEPLGAGAVVATGTLTIPEVVASGETWRARAAGSVALGSLAVAFETGEEGD